MDMKLVILVLVIETIIVFGKPTVEDEGKMTMASQHCTKKTQETQRNPD